MVARTQISDAWRARARAIVALARSWRPEEALPGARAWRDAEQAADGALAGLAEHLAIEPPPSRSDAAGEPTRRGWASASHAARPAQGDAAAAALRHRLRHAVAAAAREGDTDTIRALVGEAEQRGLAGGELVAVAERHWPRPRLHRRVPRAGARWLAGGARWAWAHRPRRQPPVVVERERAR